MVKCGCYLAFCMFGGDVVYMKTGCDHPSPNPQYRTVEALKHSEITLI